MVQSKTIHVCRTGGAFNFDQTPMVPPGAKALVYVDTNNRPNFGKHAQDAWYIGPVMEHYECMHYYIPKMQGIQTAQMTTALKQHMLQKLHYNSPYNKRQHSST